MTWKLKEYKQREAGTFPATLTSVGEAQAKVWDKALNAFKEGELKDVIRFTFQFEDGTSDNYDCNPTNSSEGGLVKFLRSMAPKTWSEAVRVNGDTLARFASKLVGQQFLVNYGPNKYGKIRLLTAFPSPSVVQKATKHEAPPPPTDDDIPF